MLNQLSREWVSFVDNKRRQRSNRLQMLVLLTEEVSEFIFNSTINDVKILCDEYLSIQMKTDIEQGKKFILKRDMTEGGIKIIEYPRNFFNVDEIGVLMKYFNEFNLMGRLVDYPLYIIDKNKYFR